MSQVRLILLCEPDTLGEKNFLEFRKRVEDTPPDVVVSVVTHHIASAMHHDNEVIGFVVFADVLSVFHPRYSILQVL